MNRRLTSSSAGEYVPLDRVGEALVVVAGGDPARGTLYLDVGVAHHDAQPRVGGHEHVVGHVADGGDLFGRNVVPGRQVLHDCALVGMRMGDVQVVGLGAGGRDVLSELLVRG